MSDRIIQIIGPVLIELVIVAGGILAAIIIIQAIA